MFKFLGLVVCCLVVPLCGFAYADAGLADTVSVGDSVLEATKQGRDAFAKFRDGNLREAMAGAITLLLFLWRRFASKLLVGRLNAWQTGLASAIIAFLAMLPVGLTDQKFAWGTFVIESLILSAESMFLWQMVGKKVLPAVFGTPHTPGAMPGATPGAAVPPPPSGPV